MATHTSYRLNKYLALALGISRREADDLISNDHVRVNNEPAALGMTIDDSSTIMVKGREITSIPTYKYFAFHKPVGYVCSRRAQGDNPTIYSLLSNEMTSLKPVGRLDKDSSGLLLLTNDGDFAHRMTHPSFRKVKIYTVTLNQPLTPLHQQMINDYGVEIGDGTSQLGLERTDDSRLHWIVTMSEGRNRQIRRTFAALGYSVVALHRTTFGPYALGGLGAGKTESITPL